MKIDDDCQAMMDLYWACIQTLKATTFSYLMRIEVAHATVVHELTYEEELDFVVNTMNPMELGAEALDGVNDILHRRCI